MRGWIAGRGEMAGEASVMVPEMDLTGAAVAHRATVIVTVTVTVTAGTRLETAGAAGMTDGTAGLGGQVSRVGATTGE